MRIPSREGDCGNLRETEKPKSFGNSVNSFLRSVLLPTPEGPESTIGRLSLGMGGVEAQLEVDMMAVVVLRYSETEDDGREDRTAA